MKRGEIEKRIDSYSNQPHFRELFRRLKSLPHDIFELRDVAKAIFSGTTPKSGGDAYCENGQGVPFIRSGEITQDGLVSEEIEIYLNEEVHNGLMKRSQLEKGDLLIAIVGATIGQIGIYDRDAPANINQAIAAVRFDRTRLSPEFVAYFLKTPKGQAILDYLKRPVARANINLEEIGDILLPVPSMKVQKDLLSLMNAAREARKKKIAEAAALLAGMDEFVLSQLGISTPKPVNSFAFAVKANQVKKGNRLNADYFHPERMNALKAIRSGKKAETVAALSEIAEFIRDVETVEDPTDYLGLANVQSNTGELVSSTDVETAGQCFRYQEGDVLFARLRPYLNKVHRAENGGVCSPEFHVIRVRSRKVNVIPDYLAVVLRSSMVVAQTKHMMTGNTHPRLTNDDVVNLIIPIPSESSQKRISIELAERRDNARRLRNEAEKDWEDAKKYFENELLSSDPKRTGTEK